MKVKSPSEYIDAIKHSGKTIYDQIDIGDPDLWIPTQVLETILDDSLKGFSLSGLALRTRSKIVKELICKSLGYPVPKSFKKKQPRFLGQQFDTYTQKSNNLQIWNEEISPTRRYVIIKISSTDEIEKVKVVTGASLALLSNTDTLTTKYQARLNGKDGECLQLSSGDTGLLEPFTCENIDLKTLSPTDEPDKNEILSIGSLFTLLQSLIDEKISYVGIDQERNRGELLHSLICKRLGYRIFKDGGQFPDIRQQLLEVKLQTSPTIDLGLVKPSSTEVLDTPKIEGSNLRHCDVRYAIFKGRVLEDMISITSFYLVTGADFFKHFSQFQGNILNGKIQINLPSDFFKPKASHTI